MDRDRYPPLDITPVWARLNEGIIALVDYIPEDKLDWSPQPGLWNFRGILMHTAYARDGWLARDVRDGGEPAEALWARGGLSKAHIQTELRRSWERLARFLSDPAKLSATYDTADGRLTGHWIAFHALEHDIHHRADVFHYLALLGIEHPEVNTP